MAELIGLERSHYSRVEKGTRRLPPEVVGAVCDVLHLTAAESVALYKAADVPLPASILALVGASPLAGLCVHVGEDVMQIVDGPHEDGAGCWWITVRPDPESGAPPVDQRIPLRGLALLPPVGFAAVVRPEAA